MPTIKNLLVKYKLKAMCLRHVLRSLEIMYPQPSE
jgi:hypothetical protein